MSFIDKIRGRRGRGTGIFVAFRKTGIVPTMRKRIFGR